MSTVSYQRNAFAPGILAAVVLLASPLLIEGEWFTAVRFAVTILAAIVAWFAVQARHWWWLVVFIPVVVLWNPVYPFAFAGQFWLAAQFVCAGAFLAAGILIKTRRA